MISESLLHAASAGAYAVTLVVLLAWLPRLPNHVRRYCYAMVAIVGLGGVTSALAAAGVGTVTVDGRAVVLPTVVSDLGAYSLLWGVTGILGGVSRRRLAVVAGLPMIQVLAFQFGASAGGLLGLGSSAVVIGGHLVLAYLFVGPIWNEAQDLPDERRLLHWKSRNLLLFLIGMLIAFAFLSLTGVFSTFGSALINQYISVLIRVGFAGFLFANVGALAAEARDGAAPLGGSVADRADAAD